MTEQNRHIQIISYRVIHFHHQSNNPEDGSIQHQTIQTVTSILYLQPEKKKTDFALVILKHGEVRFECALEVVANISCDIIMNRA